MRVVKSPSHSFKNSGKWSLGNPIEFPHVTLRLVLEILDAGVLVLLVCKELGVVDPKVLEVRNIQRIVALPAVGINDAVGNDFPLDDRHQGLGAGIRNDLRVDPSTTLQQTENRDFSRNTTAPLSFAATAEIGFIHFDLAAANHFAILLKVIGADRT